MRKLVLVSLFAVLALAGCSSDSENSTSTSLSLKDDPEFVATCNEGLVNLGDGLTAITEAAPLLKYASGEDVNAFLSTAREFVNTSLDLVDTCSVLDPPGAASLRSSLQELLSTINS